MNDVTKPQSFEQRMFERMRENVSQLMTDEDLKKLLDSTIEKMFFTPRTVNDGRYNVRTDPPEIFNLVKELLEPQLKKALAEHMELHQKDIKQAIDRTIAGGFTAALSRCIDAQMAPAMHTLQGQLYNIISANNLKTP